MFVLSEAPTGRPKFYYYFVKNPFDFPKKMIWFWEKFSSPQSVSH